MLSILHVDTGTELRGGQWQILTLAQGLRKRGHLQAIAVPKFSPLEERARLCGIATFPLTSGSAWNWQSVRLLRRFIRERRFQIIHAHDGRGQTFAWLASRGELVRRVASRRVAFTSNRFLHRVKYSLTCDAVIAVSASVRKRLVDCGIPPARIAVIPDGIETPESMPGVEERRLARAEWELADQDFVIGHMGAFTVEKGQDLALEAVRLLAGKLPRVVLLLAGNGPTRQALERAAAPPTVRFLGWVEDLRRFFACLDLFVMPSRSEGLGSSALLAMAYGLPVIASRTGGLTEIIEEGRTGWLVQPGIAPALAQGVEHAIFMREKLQGMGQAGREKSREFSSDILTVKTEALYRHLLGCKP
jgi:glycosyltransferase involved in cell wall biosynthesis